MPDLYDLLEKTSRTFALSIPRLPEPTRREVAVAYLLFRIADTFEDASESDPDHRISALHELGRMLDGAGGAGAGRGSDSWLERISVDHDGYRELLRETPYVLDSFGSLRPAARKAIRDDLRRTIAGMADFVARTENGGELRLRDLEDLRSYCYTVAGIVGEMLTELFLIERAELEDVAPGLRARARDFGEGLQLVNVLKDSQDDVDEGRRYLPPGADRDRIFRLARRDLDRATEYVRLLQDAGAEPGLVAFNALPVKLAWATLDVVEERGPGSKISRDTVWRLVGELERALEEQEPAVRSRDSSRLAG